MAKSLVSGWCFSDLTCPSQFPKQITKILRHAFCHSQSLVQCHPETGLAGGQASIAANRAGLMDA